MQKKLLIISYFSPPDLNAESILVGKTLSKLANEYDITLVTAVGTGNKQDMELYNLINRSQIRILSIPTLKKPKWLPNYSLLTTYWYRFVDYVWAKRAAQKVSQLHDKYDFLYSRSQPGISHIVALAIKKRLAIPWIAQFSDPWANNPYHRHGQQRIKKIEAEIATLAEALIFPTKEIQGLYHFVYSELRLTKKTYVIPHSYDDSLYPSNDLKARINGKIVLSYIGDFYGLRSPEGLLKALRLLLSNNPGLKKKIEIHIWGLIDENYTFLIKNTYSDLENILILYNQVPYKESLLQMKMSDILLLIDASSTTTENLFLPSKLIDYFGSRNPVLGITPVLGSTAEYLTKFGFPVCDPADINKIAVTIENMIRDLPKYREIASYNDYSVFDSTSFVKVFKEIMSEIS